LEGKTGASSRGNTGSYGVLTCCCGWSARGPVCDPPPRDGGGPLPLGASRPVPIRPWGMPRASPGPLCVCSLQWGKTATRMRVAPATPSRWFWHVYGAACTVGRAVKCIDPRGAPGG